MTLLPAGIRDSLPPHADARAALIERVVATVAMHGYERVDPALIEHASTLRERLGNAQADVLRFTDPASGETLAIRSDITGQVGRIAATRLAAAPRPLRLSYGGSVVRVRGTDLNPARALTQAGAELVGADHVAAVREVIGLALEALAACGVGGLILDLTLPTLVQTIADGHWGITDIAAVQARLDAKDVGALPVLGAARYAALVAAAGPVEPALSTLRALSLGVDVTRLLDDTAAAAAGWDVTVTLDPAERHGFEYQSWLGFSLYADGFATELGRGGTYRVGHADGAAEAAVGFSLFLDPLVDAGHGQTATRRVELAPGTPASVGAKLRAEGVVTVARF